MKELAANIWIRDGGSVPFLGIPYPTRMCVVRLRDGSLWVWSPIRLDERLVDDVNRLGPVRHLVSPNKLHHIHLGDWATRWPDAKLYASPGLRRRRPDLKFDIDLKDAADPAWAAEIGQVVFHGSFALEEVVFFHRSSKTVLVGDLVQKFDPNTLRGWQRLVMGLDGMLGPSGSTPREWRLSFWNRRAARAALRTALAWQPERLVIAHGAWADRNGTDVLRRSLAWLGI